MKKSLMWVLCISVLIFCAMSVQARLNDGIISYWNFDVGVSDVVGSNDGTLYGPTHITSGQKLGAGAYTFDGSNDQIDLGDVDSFEGRNQISYSFWVKPSGSTSSGMVFSKWSVSHIEMCNGNKLCVIFYDPAGNLDARCADEVFSANQWYHVVVVFDSSLPKGELEKIYVDGNLQSGNGISGGCVSSVKTNIPSGNSLYSDTYTTKFGSSFNGGYASFFSGAIDEGVIWNRALSAYDALVLYNSGAGLNPLNYSAVPSATTFDISSGSTNFSVVGDLNSVSNATLAKSFGKIKWDGSPNVNGLDFDSYVTIDDRFVKVDIPNLDSSLNSSAEITFEDVGCDYCNGNGIFYSATGSSIDEVRSSGVTCGAAGKCSDFSCSNNDCTFTVTSFSGYAYGGNANLTINDSAEGSYVENDTSATFYAYYVNATSGALISGASCTVDFDDGSGAQAMSEGGSYYSYTKSAGFSSAGTHNWNVSCSKAGYASLFAEDTISVQNPNAPVSIPEFSTWTLLIGLMIVIGGFLAIRRQE